MSELKQVGHRSKVVLMVAIATAALLVSVSSRASILFEWVCDDVSACFPSSTEVFEGTITFADAGYAPGGSFTNTTGDLVEAFSFTSTILGANSGASPWELGDLFVSLTGLEWAFDGSGSTLTVLNHPSSAIPNTWEFNNSQILDVGATLVDDFRNFRAIGQWQLVRDAQVTEPATIAVLALGLLALKRRNTC